MIRQDIRLGDYRNKGDDFSSYKYVIDYLRNGIDFNDDITKHYVMCRNGRVINNVQYDTDVYIIEKELVNSDVTLFPITNGSYISFSKDFKAFNSDFTELSFKNGGVDIYDIVDITDEESGIPALCDVPCDIVRIYHPHNKTQIDAIVYVDVMINDTHFHLLCQQYDTFQNNADNDFEIDHCLYSEYIDCYVPSIDYLMSGKAYYREIEYKIDVVNAPELQQGNYVALKLYSMPFSLKDIDDSLGVTRLYDTKYTAGLEQYDGIWPIRVTLAPYTSVDDNTATYVNESGMEMNSDMFYDHDETRLVASVGWDKDRTISVITRFDIPGRQPGESIADAYERHYHVDLSDYTGIVEFNDEDEIDEDDYEEQKQCGFYLTIYTDYGLTSKAGRYIFNIDNPKEQLDDFAIHLNDILKDWNQVPDILIAQTTFTDLWTGTILNSEPLYLSNEVIKYMINDSHRGTINLNNMNMNDTKFISSIRCNIHQNIDTTTIAEPSSSSPKVIYRPIFYRANDLQNIQIYTNITQNVGIALSDYMTKVETFKLLIGTVQFKETGRNDIYVIFSVNGTGLAQGTMPYHIVNQDDELVSSGTVTIL